MITQNKIQRIKWLWNTDTNRSLKSTTSTWQNYSDVENEIIEEAYQSKRKIVELDDYRIDHDRQVQISTNNSKIETSIQRVVCTDKEKSLRVERFMPEPIHPDAPFNPNFGYGNTIFITEAMKLLNVTEESLKNPHYHGAVTREKIVIKAANGIIQEGLQIKRNREAKWLSEQLLKVKGDSRDDIWECCAYLYTLESFLYKKLNEVQRIVGSKKHEHLWKAKLSTLGPFAILLQMGKYDERRFEGDLYRGADLSEDMITQFKNSAIKDDICSHTFQAFTSCSRNRNEAEKIGNVLFIININGDRTLDVSPYSIYKNEEEELLPAGFWFNVRRVDFDSSKNKHYIYLN